MYMVNEMVFLVIFPIFAANYSQPCYRNRKRDPHSGFCVCEVVFVLYEN